MPPVQNGIELMIDRRDFLKYSAAIGGLQLLPDFGFASNSSKRPNVIFIIVDDSEFIEYGCYGGRVLTPNIDSIAKNGVLFTNGFTSSSVCTPTRYTCMSGKYAGRAKSLATRDHQPADMATFVRWNTDLESGGSNIASVLKNNGYITGMAGKWHISHGRYYQDNINKIKKPESLKGKKAMPLDDSEVNKYLKSRYAVAVEDMKKSFGFDYVAAFYGGNITGQHKFAKHNQDWITKGAVDFIDKNAKGEKPFFLYFSTTLQHGPSPKGSIEADRRISSAGLLDKAPDVQPDYHSIYQRLDWAGVSRNEAPSLWLDDGIGAILERLKAFGIEKDTAIFFFSDQQSWGKSSCFDGGVNTPYLFSWPREVKAGQVCEELVSNIDFAPTIFDICSVRPPSDMHLDGKSFLPIVQGKTFKRREAVFFELGNMRAVRTKNFKYIAVRRYSDNQWAKLPKDVRESQEYRRRYFRLNKQWRASPAAHLKKSKIAKWRYDHAKYAEDSDQLYDLRVDPGENVNLADNAEYSEVLKEMKGLLGGWLKTMPGPFGEFKKN